MDFALIPHRLFTYIKMDANRAYHLNVLISTMLVIIAMFVVYGPASGGGLIPNVCLVDALFGINCPFCGTTRSLGAFFHGDLAAAWQYNRAAVFFAAYLLVQVPLRIYMLRRKMDLNNTLSKSLRLASWILLSVFIINWIITILIYIFSL